MTNNTDAMDSTSAAAADDTTTTATDTDSSKKTAAVVTTSATTTTTTADTTTKDNKPGVAASVAFADDTLCDTTHTHATAFTSDDDDPREVYQTKSKGIRFPSKDDVLNERFNISRLSTYELEEIMAVWGDKEEQIENRIKLKQEVREFAQGRRLSDNMTFTSMGLTDKIGIGRLEKQHYRQEGYEAVLGTQETQRVMALDGLDQVEGSPCHPSIRNEVIAAIYSNTVEPASLKAHQEALALHHEVEKY